MKEKQLSNDQKNRIAEIKKKWSAELDKLPDVAVGNNSLSHASNNSRVRLEKKYLPKIKAIYNEEENGHG